MWNECMAGTSTEKFQEFLLWCSLPKTLLICAFPFAGEIALDTGTTWVLQLDFMPHLPRTTFLFFSLLPPFFFLNKDQDSQPSSLPLTLLSTSSKVESVPAPTGKPANWKSGILFSSLGIWGLLFTHSIRKEGSSGAFLQDSSLDSVMDHTIFLLLRSPVLLCPLCTCLPEAAGFSHSSPQCKGHWAPQWLRLQRPASGKALQKFQMKRKRADSHTHLYHFQRQSLCPFYSKALTVWNGLIMCYTTLAKFLFL